MLNDVHAVETEYLEEIILKLIHSEWGETEWLPLEDHEIEYCSKMAERHGFKSGY